MSVLRAEKSRHPAWIVIAILLCIAGPFIAILTPVILAVTTYQYSSRITYVPLPNGFNYYLAAFVLTGVLLIFVYFISKKSLKITFAIVATCLFLFLFYSGASQYHYFDKNYIEIGSVLDKKQYSWSDVQEAVIVVDSAEFRSLFLTMNDSKEIEILLAGVVNSKAEMSIRNRLIENNVEIKYAD
ncbi:hypothetical protein [Ureibacillus acetophenoni]|uniref:PH (Pleckstrin Homology) domain-containing protein n=1 Tax=Ureibacillus acetophenoni TaxID=614649 RepID=A0A285UDJ5_9BACL|nr:hypothetical protein [Ureibacillus acetophenoni]SOC39950.1 hypothetical protein SAMN05877842_106203 [Ureibacillus acetophenoni]